MVEMVPTDIAHGGEAVARVDGKAHFVAGAIPGETIEAEIVEDRARWARARLVDVLAPSEHRIDPPCPAFGICGGCTWQFAEYALQLEWKHSTVAGQLAHLGGLVDPPVRPTVASGAPYGYRNRMDFAVLAGRPALHRSRSDDLVALDACLLLHPELAELYAGLGDLTGMRRLTLRVGTRTGDRMAIVDGKVPSQAASWPADVVQRRGGSYRTIRGRRWIEEEVAGTRFRIPAGAFFQVNTPAAGHLVDLVGEALAVRSSDVLLDGYAGVGLFAGTIGPSAARVLAVDSGGAATSACRENLDRIMPGRFAVTTGRFERVAGSIGERWHVAVVDPPRAGLGSEGVAAVIRPGPRSVAYVSCDPAALARDARILRDNGYRLDWAAPVDMFPQTFHVETVARFVRM
jgi:23S rRNA (uracil1939-C5)-methyltransferase